MIQVVCHHAQLADLIIKENALHARIPAKHAKMDLLAHPVIMDLSCKQTNVFKNAMMDSSKTVRMFAQIVMQLAHNVRDQKYPTVLAAMKDSLFKELHASQDVLMVNI